MAEVPAGDLPDSLRGTAVPEGDLPGAATPPTVGQKAYAFGRGLVKGTLETPSAIEQIGRFGPKFPSMQKPTQIFPTGEQVSRGMAEVGLPEPRKEVTGYQTAGEVAPAALALGKGALQLGKFGITKASELARSLRKPEPIAKVEDLAEVGEKGFGLLTKKAEQLYQARKAEAEQKYGEAFNAARAAQATGQPFATSTQGRALIQSLERDKTVPVAGEVFAKGEEKVKGIDRLIKAIEGSTTGGYTRVGKEAPGGKQIYYTSGTPKKTVEKDIEAIVEELRFLRDVDAKGKPYEAYAALDAKYKRDLIDRLERSLYEWNPQYKAADEAYKAASRKLDPFRTQLMTGALKGEKFDPKALVKSPEEFGSTFFADVNGVRQLKEVTQDPAAVTQLGKEYVASIFADKSPAQVMQFATNPKNAAWMKEAGIKDVVDAYAKQATTAQSRQEILKKLGYVSAGAIGMGTVGPTLYYGVRRTFGL